jgi:hypothetical protein
MYHVTCVYQDMLKPLINLALQISQLRELTGRKEPNVIT